MRKLKFLSCLFLVAISGCGSSNPSNDAGADAMPPDFSSGEALIVDAKVTADQGETCVKPSAGMQIAKDTTLCAGEYSLGDASSKGAIQITAPNITVSCKGTVLKGGKLYKTTDPKEIGIVIKNQQNVTVKGCAVHGYRFALVAATSKGLSILENDFSDNFTDEKAEWVFDSVQGGGIRFDSVTGSTIEKNKLSRNWNAIDLRASDSITVKKNNADHCSNTAGLILNTHHSTFQENDFSWGVRGGLTYPSHWYGVDTKDSAGLLLDAGSSYNTITNNNITYGGDGLFLRAVIGACPHHNTVDGNDTSYSPHNAIESWCDDNSYRNNKANFSNYGFWLGGSDRTVIENNVVTDNHVDGFSIQIGESRYVVLDQNIVKNNKRCGMLLTGREYQEWETLNNWSAKLANASQYLIQRNQFGGNGSYDVFLTSIRGVLLASNSYTGSPKTNVGKEALDVRTIGSWPVSQNTPPTAKLSFANGSVNQPLVLDASASTDPGGATLTYYWLVQDSLTAFDPAVMPVPLLSGLSGSKPSITPSRPGVFDVAMIVDNGSLGANAGGKLYVTSSADDHCEKNGTSWTYECPSSQCTTKISDDTAISTTGTASIHATTDTPYSFILKLKAPSATPWNVSVATKIGLFVRAKNPNGSWQSKYPILVLRSAQGSATYTPTVDWMKAAQEEWKYLEIPIAGSSSWVLVNQSVNLGAITSVEVQMDSLGYLPYEVWLDGLGWY
jgi:parallel beta-helix repeat protein